MRFFVSILSFHEYGGISTKLDLRFLLQFAPATHRIAKSIRKTSRSSTQSPCARIDPKVSDMSKVAGGEGVAHWRTQALDLVTGPGIW